MNLTDEHTDYSDGSILSCAIDYQTVIGCAPCDNRKARVMAVDYENQSDEFSLDALIVVHENCQWTSYVHGMVKHLQLCNNDFGGVDMVTSGNVPQGTGSSSSVSPEVVVGTVLQQLYHLPLDGTQIALNGQEVENRFVGCNCGIIDRLTSALGKRDRALLVNYHPLGTKVVSMPKGVTVVIIDSSSKRTLAGSECNTRREQCEIGVRFLQQLALRDVIIEEFNAITHRLDPIAVKRVRHILTENTRTVEVTGAPEQGDLKHMSELVAESHASIRDSLEITVPQINTLVEIVKAMIGDKGGVRATGSGFGGCIVTLIPKELVSIAQQAVAEQCKAKIGIRETFYVCKPLRGAGQR